MRQTSRSGGASGLEQTKLMNKTVLIIEDQPMNMTLMSYLLEQAGHTVLKATTAEAGIALAISDQPDLILMDIALPGLDGLNATKALQNDVRTKDIPVIAVTAHAMTGDAQRAKAVGCRQFITKPINTRTFVDQVNIEMGIK